MLARGTSDARDAESACPGIWTAGSDDRLAVSCGGLRAATAARREWSLRDGTVCERRDSHYLKWTARTVVRWPSHLYADGHSAPDCDDAGSSQWSVRDMDIDFPFHFDGRGRTADVDIDGHIRDLIEQVLFTAPGERINRPTFGSGLMQLVFAPNSDELAAVTQSLVQGALQQWLGDLIQVNGVRVENQESTLRVTIQYVVRRTQQQQVAQFTRGVVGP